MSAKIQKIVLNIDGNEIKLTLKQAKELKKLLSETFGEEKTIYSPVILEPIYRRTLGPYWSAVWSSETSDTVTFSSMSGDISGETGESALLIS
jgi:hypothetical protein